MQQPSANWFGRETAVDWGLNIVLSEDPLSFWIINNMRQTPPESVMKGCENGCKCGTFKEEEVSGRDRQGIEVHFYSQCYLDSLAVLFIRRKPAKKYRPALIWRLNYFRDNLYDFLWERRRTRRAAKASLRPWFGHSDIDLTVKTGAGELWCHDSMLSLLLSLKEDGSEGWAVEGETEGKSGGQWVKEWWRRFGIKQMN